MMIRNEEKDGCRTPRTNPAALRRRWTSILSALGALLVVVLLAASGALADETQPKGTATERTRVPMVSTEGPTRRVEG
jgi:hypothetical protein